MADDVGSLLLRSGIVAAEQLESARLAVKEHGGTVPEELVRGGFIDDEELTAFYRSRLLIPRVNPSELTKLTTSLLSRLPADMATEFRSIPVALDGEGNLTLVMSDPSDTKAADEIGFFTGNYVMRAIATQAQIAWCLAHYYKQKTGLYLDLVADGQWPDADDDMAAEAKAGDSSEKDTMPMGVPALGSNSAGKKTRPGRRSTNRESQAVEINLDAETGPLQARTSRPRHQQPSPPELFARAGEITTTAQPDREVDTSPAVVVSLNPEESAVIIDTQRGTDTAPILLSDVKKRLAEQEAAEQRGADEAHGAQSEGPIILDQSRRKRRSSRHTEQGVGVGGSQAVRGGPTLVDEVPHAMAASQAAAQRGLEAVPPRTHDLVGDKQWGEPGTTIPPGFLGAAPSTYEDVAEGIPVAIEEDVTSEIRAMGATPVPLSPDADRTAPNAIPGAIRHSNMADASSRLLLALRAIDHAETKDDVVEPLLDFLDGAFERTGFMALRQDDLVAFQIHGCADNVGGKVHMSIDEDSSFTSAVRMRLPYNGPIEDGPTKKLARDIDIPDAFDVLALPLMIRERVVGVLFGMGSHSKVFEEHLAVLGQAAGEAFEELLRKRRS